jgi:hypothetical protein
MIGLNDVKQLLSQANDQTLSLYLGVDPAAQENQATIPAWKIWLKNALKSIEKDVTENQHPAWEDIRARLDTFLDTYAADSKALALFYGPTIDVVHPLPLPVQNQATFGKPMIGPLLWAIDEYEPYLVVLVDNEKASFVTAHLGSADQQDSMQFDLDTSDWFTRTVRSSGGSTSTLPNAPTREDFEQRVEAHLDRFLEDVARHAQEMAQKQGAGRIVLGGNEEVAHKLLKELPEKAQQMVIGVMSIPMRATPHEVLEQILPAVLDYERQREMELVEQVVNLAKAGGRGAIGKESVMHALDQQRVELLIIPWPMPDGDGLMSELPLRIMESGGAMELVHGAAAERVKAEGGLAARLYYAL